MRLVRQVETAVATFEPRLAGVKVTLVDGGGNTVDRLLRFQIEGLLKMDPAPEQVSFDTVLQLMSGEYQVKGEPGA
jgi:type VI secretion system protein ImpF